jgi:hypothetical protein
MIIFGLVQTFPFIPCFTKGGGLVHMLASLTSRLKYGSFTCLTRRGVSVLFLLIVG